MGNTAISLNFLWLHISTIKSYVRILSLVRAWFGWLHSDGLCLNEFLCELLPFIAPLLMQTAEKIILPLGCWLTGLLHDTSS